MSVRDANPVKLYLYNVVISCGRRILGEQNAQNEPWLEDLGKLGATLIGKSTAKPIQNVSMEQGSSNWSSQRRR